MIKPQYIVKVRSMAGARGHGQMAEKMFPIPDSSKAYNASYAYMYADTVVRASCVGRSLCKMAVNKKDSNSNNGRLITPKRRLVIIMPP
jgi:hypothetical protein